MDLAVLEEGIPRVRIAYGLADFTPLGDEDPIILAQPSNDTTFKKGLSYQYIYYRYLSEYAKKDSIVEVKTWFEGRLHYINHLLRELG